MSLRLKSSVLRVGLAVLPFAALLAAGACGGSDVAEEPGTQTDAGPDGLARDAVVDHQVADHRADEGASADASDATVSALDGSDATPGADAGDAAKVDASDATALADANLADADAALLDANLGDADAALLDANLPDAALLDVNIPDTAVLDVGLPDADAALDASPDASPDASDSGTFSLMPSLGTASTYAVLSAATVTNSDVGGLTTVLLGDVGTTGPSITGLTGHPFQPSGNTVIGLAATQPVLDTGTALVFLNGKACGTAMTGQDLGGKTLTPGVYCVTSSALQSANTVLTFDAKNDPNAVFIVQVGTALTVLDGASVNLINGANGCRIWFALGTSATLNGGVLYAGNMVAGAGVNLLKGAALSPGRALATTQGVTLLSNTIKADPVCQ